VEPGTVDWFHRTFAECGLRPETHRVSYGLAEATVLISATPTGRSRRVTADRTRLGFGELSPSRTGVTLMSSGRPAGQEVRIVEHGRVLPDGRIGEIWVRGPNVGAGYWGDDERTAATFGATLDDPGETGGGWLRTGDLGVWHEGELFVTGRTSDVIVIDGRSHYPQDIESAVEAAHPAIRSHHVAAVAGPDGDRVVVLAERSRWMVRVDLAEVAMAVREAMTCGIPVEVVLLEPGTLPRTTSGKVSRSASRRAFLDGALPPGT
jgi:acyl-CoA synthetase (AMP-forming)/AMP-acid ligase II